MSKQDASPIVNSVPLPAHWYLGIHGDPVATFDFLWLHLHADGTVSWTKEDVDV